MVAGGGGVGVVAGEAGCWCEDALTSLAGVGGAGIVVVVEDRLVLALSFGVALVAGGAGIAVVAGDPGRRREVALTTLTGVGGAGVVVVAGDLFTDRESVV